MLRGKWQKRSRRRRSSSRVEKIETDAIKARNVLRSIDVLGFNSQKYDIPLIKNYLPSRLARMGAIPRFVVKKGGGYMMIASPKLKFLDNKFSCRGNITREIVQLLQRVHNFIQGTNSPPPPPPQANACARILDCPRRQI